MLIGHTYRVKRKTKDAKEYRWFFYRSTIFPWNNTNWMSVHFDKALWKTVNVLWAKKSKFVNFWDQAKHNNMLMLSILTSVVYIKYNMLFFLKNISAKSIYPDLFFSWYRLFNVSLLFYTKIIYLVWISEEVLYSDMYKCSSCWRI